MMTKISLAWLALSIPVTAAEPGESLFQQVEQLSRTNQKAAALAKAEEAVVELERAKAAGEKIGRRGMEGLRLSAQLAREDFLDYDKSLFFCNKMLEFADTDYWIVPARLEIAMTYRAMGDFAKAQREYEKIAESDERHRVRMLVPQAEMILFEIGDQQRGRKLLEAALMNTAVNGRERFNSLNGCAKRALEQGDRQEALVWYQLLEKLPFDKADERARFLSQVWYEMGKIEESLGRTDQAKDYYRKTMELSDGEMRYRAQARDALESIEYFE
jgi:tetratricopeptide (TPR) repeat protein